MNDFVRCTVVGISALVGILMSPSAAMAANYKCKGADGKIEYSDRPCDTNKESLSQHQGSSAVSTPAISPLTRLETLFTDYEPRLCEREILASEVDVAQRSGELKKAEATWKPKQERLSFLNDSLIEFQEKAGKVTRGTASDGAEMMAVRRFQRKLKDCGAAKK